MLNKAIATFLYWYKKSYRRILVGVHSLQHGAISNTYVQRLKSRPAQQSTVNSISDLRKPQNTNTLIHPCIHFTTPAKTIISAAVNTTPMLSTTYQFKCFPGGLYVHQHTCCYWQHLNAPVQRTRISTCTLAFNVDCTGLVNPHRLVADSMRIPPDCQPCYVLQYFPIECGTLQPNENIHPKTNGNEC